MAVGGDWHTVRTLSVWAFLREFQQNSRMATTMAKARPHINTTNTPPGPIPRKKNEKKKNRKNSEDVHWGIATGQQCSDLLLTGIDEYYTGVNHLWEEKEEHLQRRTPNPPIFSTPSALALESLFFSSLLQTSPVFFHHLLYNIWMIPFSCSSSIAKEILSLHGEPVCRYKWKEKCDRHVCTVHREI